MRLLLHISIEETRMKYGVLMSVCFRQQYIVHAFTIFGKIPLRRDPATLQLQSTWALNINVPLFYALAS